MSSDAVSLGGMKSRIVTHEANMFKHYFDEASILFADRLETDVEKLGFETRFKEYKSNGKSLFILETGGLVTDQRLGYILWRDMDPKWAFRRDKLSNRVGPDTYRGDEDISRLNGDWSFPIDSNLFQGVGICDTRVFSSVQKFHKDLIFTIATIPHDEEPFTELGTSILNGVKYSDLLPVRTLSVGDNYTLNYDASIYAYGARLTTHGIRYSMVTMTYNEDLLNMYLAVLPKTKKGEFTNGKID